MSDVAGLGGATGSTPACSAWSPSGWTAPGRRSNCSRGHGNGLTVLTADEVVVDADTAEIPVGIDGETVMLPTPVRCTIQPRALSVVVPRERPGVPAPKAALEWPRLRQLASFRPQPDHVPLPAQPGRR